MDFAKATLEQLLAEGGHECACGRRHETGLKRLEIGRGALERLPETLRGMGWKKPFLMSDRNTEAAAGARAKALLTQADMPYAALVLDRERLEPDERTLGALCMAFDPTCDVVLAVGSGVINDCCKVLAKCAGKPCAVVATAPSMDGYASDSASMIQNGMKVSLYIPCPRLIVADTDVLAAAPLRALRSGLGDMLAKYVSLCEWRISRIVTGEYYCENIAGLMRESLRRIRESADGLLRREPAAVESVMQGLALSGVAMSFARISRPASGLEHYFSHLWEMWMLQGELPYSTHGEQVGVGTCLTLELYDHIRTLVPDREKALRALAAFSPEKWETDMRTLFGPVADEVLALERGAHKNDPEKVRAHIDALVGHWDEIQQIIAQELPPTQEIVELMKRLGMAYRPEDIGIGHEDTIRAYIGSREIRDKYLTSSMLWELGELDDFRAYL
ncbi:MAG: sn-glycerol-1-phosphate dehydrogenase [Eubacteriales bacterium]|nr:sn-glycerol-1-phosphate dehydrogenase [Eubacteriales bacterium]